MRRITAIAWLLMLLCTPAISNAQEQAGEEKEQAEPAAESPRDVLRNVQTLLREKKLDEAETAYKAGREAFPDNATIRDLKYQFYLTEMRSGNSKAAAGHLAELIDDYVANIDSAPVSSRLGSYMLSYLSVASRAGQQAEAMEKAEKVAVALENGDNPSSFNVASMIRQRQAMSLAAQGKKKKARKLVEASLAKFDEKFGDNPSDPSVAVLRANALRYVALVADRTGADDAEELNAKHSDYVEMLWKNHPDNRTVANTYMNARLGKISAIARKEPYKAQEQLDALREMVTKLKDEEKLPATMVSSYDRSFASLTRTIEGARKHYDLIGKPAAALDTEAWVNGSALTDDDLKGKVVLLDFWAVWCGPCIATFPHLKEWQEQYADKGLVIIGVTRYYNYAWNDDAGRASRSKDEVAPEDENVMLEKFAALHGLEHRFAVTPKDSKFQSEYGVSGIPQAVVVDQEGKIRLIRVGSGEANAKDIHDLLEELLGDSEKASE